MSFLKNFPRVTWSRVLIVVVAGVLAVIVTRSVGSNEWVAGLLGGGVVALGSFLGARWHQQDQKRVATAKKISAGSDIRDEDL